jgi:hypothetical protein
MEKEFVDYNIALALKELGFDEPCIYYVDEQNNSFIYNFQTHLDEFMEWCGVKVIPTPTYSKVFRWFRKEHNLFGYSYPNDYQMYGYRIVELKNPENKELIYDWGTLNTSEEAELECLKKLIEIVKKQKI